MEEFDDSLVDEELLYALICGVEELPSIQQEEDEETRDIPYEEAQSFEPTQSFKPTQNLKKTLDFEQSECSEKKAAVLEEVEITQEITENEPEYEKPEESIGCPKRRERLSSGSNMVTVITRGTLIQGNIHSDCSLDVLGTVEGNIECTGSLTISGKVTGNLNAQEVYVDAERLNGSIKSEGAVKIGVGTVVIGDITAAAGTIAGAVKGNIDISGPVLLDSTAIIQGDIRAKSIQMAHGAVLEGYCSLCYASVEIDNIFE